MRNHVLASCLIALGAVPVAAANVNLSANLVNSCVLTVGTDGIMTPAANGIQISSENSGGSAASLTLVAIGAQPSVSFAAPGLTSSPAGWTASHTNSIRYTSTGGANQSYTSTASSITVNGLSDAFTIHGKVDSAAGFAAGNYTLTTVATCSQ